MTGLTHSYVYLIGPVEVYRIGTVEDLGDSANLAVAEAGSHRVSEDARPGWYWNHATRNLGPAGPFDSIEAALEAAEKATGLQLDRYLDFCAYCAEAGVRTIAVTRRPEPRKGFMGAVPGTFPRGVPLCETCAAEWDAAPSEEE